ncbi:zinc finger protein, partial [Streptoalloteichus hindustanus]
MSDTFPYHSYTWLPHDGARHAYPGEKRPDGQAVTTYCRLTATTTTYDNPRAPERLWPECPTCKTLVDQVADRRA